MSSFHRTFVSYSSIVPFAVWMSSLIELAFPYLRISMFSDRLSDRYSFVPTMCRGETSVLYIV